jgi:alpha-1,3-rhamnosyl/mannosyltransferase
VGLDARALAGSEATGVGRYILALLEAFDAMSGLRVVRYGREPPPLLGPQLLSPLKMQRDGSDVIHGPANALPLVRYGVPGVVTVHDLAIYQHPEWFPKGQWFATRVVVPQSIRHARAVICPSMATRSAVLHLFGIRAERCHVIPHGVERSFSQPVTEARRKEVRDRYRLPPRYLLQVGTVQPRKNYATTVRAMARIPVGERLPLVVIGNFGWDYEPIKDLIRELDLGDWVHFAGYAGLPDLPAIYQSAEAGVFPSLDEGFGIPVLEAFAAGVPLAASNAGAIPEVAGDAALLSEPEDDHALAANLHRLIADRDLRQRLIAAGRLRASRFTWQASAAAHRAVYESVVRG